MNVVSIKTHKLTEKDTDILKILDQYLISDRHSGEQRDSRISSEGDAGQASMTKGILQENSVVAVTSKIISICEGNFVAIEKADKDTLIQKEAEYFLPRSSSKYNVCLTITRGMLAASAGVDESNAFGNFILWPKDPQESANMIREHLCKKFGVKNVGVIITDSKTTPLRWGVTANAIAYSGFAPLKDYIGTLDLFDRPFAFEKMSIIDGLATSAALVMGEGREQTPLAVITDLPFVDFQARNPTDKELESLKIDIRDDLYSPLLTSVKWEKGVAK